MSTAQPIAPSRGVKWSAAVLAALLGVAAVLLFAAIYFALPAHNHYYALIGIGILALVFSVGSYFAEAFSQRPVAQRALAWGFMAMGFTVLLVSIALGPMFIQLALVAEFVALLVVVLALIVAVAFIAWRTRALAATELRLRKREAWQASGSPSALDYPAAHAPSTPQVPAPAPNDPAPPRSP
jgi:glucan phosphoethanolaminetransferase (alkaline phosphatase superfamily)